MIGEQLKDEMEGLSLLELLKTDKSLQPLRLRHRTVELKR